MWLRRWEWACCGDPFEVGDQVDFGIESRDASELLDRLGPKLAATVDALESHHEEDFPVRVRGKVVAIHAVSHEVVERSQEHIPGTTVLEPVRELRSAQAQVAGPVGALGSEQVPDGHQRVRRGWLVDVDEARVT